MTESAPQSGKERFKKWMRIPLIIALLALAIAPIIPEVQTYMLYSKALQWTEVPATMSALQFDITVRLKDPYFQPLAQYKYIVDGREFTGERLSMGSPMLGYDMSMWEQTHAAGKPVTVRVDPDNPANAILEPTPDLVLLLGRALAMLMFCSLIYISTYPVAYKRQQPASSELHELHGEPATA